MGRQTAAVFETKKIRYSCSDTPDHIYLQIKDSVEAYFVETNLPKHATVLKLYKTIVLTSLTVQYCV